MQVAVEPCQRTLKQQKAFPAQNTRFPITPDKLVEKYNPVMSPPQIRYSLCRAITQIFYSEPSFILLDATLVRGTNVGSKVGTLDAIKVCLTCV